MSRSVVNTFELAGTIVEPCADVEPSPRTIVTSTVASEIVVLTNTSPVVTFGVSENCEKSIRVWGTAWRGIEVTARLWSRITTPASGTFGESTRSQPLTVGATGWPVMLRISAEIEPLAGIENVLEDADAEIGPPSSAKMLIVTDTGEAAGLA